jgi:hypothetical protein
MTTPAVKREMVNEAVAIGGKKVSPLRGRKQSAALIAKRTAARNRTLRMMNPVERKKLGRHKKVFNKIKPAVMKEWSRMCANVAGYLDFRMNGAVISESAIRQDNKGNVVSLKIPTLARRNEGKILDLGYKTLDHEVKVIRGKMKKISEDQIFVKAMADLKRYNNISDNSALEETLEAIVSRWPDLIYVNQTELAEQISVALESANLTNFDDNTCDFMAEAILRTAHNVYTDRVSKIAKLSGVKHDITAECKECEDSYKDFAEASQRLFNKMDESESVELRIFSDLYNALHEVHRAAVESGDEAVRIEAADFLKDCQAVLNRKTSIDMGLAESIADYLADLLEAEMADGVEDGWNKGAEVSVGGDHSMTKWNAKQANVASNSIGDWKTAAPVSDGKDYHGNLADEMGNDGWSNIGGADIYPDLKNPYVPKSDSPKVKDTDGGDGLVFSNKDTWPNLRNPLALEPKTPKPVV